MRSTTVVRLRRNRSTPSLDDLKPDAPAPELVEPAAAAPALAAAEPDPEGLTADPQPVPRRAGRRGPRRRAPGGTGADGGDAHATGAGGDAPAPAEAETATAPPARRAGILAVATGQRTTRGLFLVVASLLGLGLVSLTVGVDGAGTTTVGDYLAGRPGAVLTATDGAFRAEFPGSPQRRSQQVDANGAQVTVVDYTAGRDDHSFTVSYAEIPPGQEVGDPVLRLNASANGAAEAVKGELRTTAITSFLGLPAVEYLIVVKGRYIKATSFISGRRLYGVQVVGRRDPPDGYGRFRSAFQLRR